LKVEAAAQEWAGGLSAKTIYKAIRDGKLKAARIGAGRNLLVCEQFITDWLLASAARRTDERA
jgi:UDP-N-acetylenolpyruvoylglucosamine reductase